MLKIHNELEKTFAWYHDWHKHPRHKHAHWLFFASVSLALFLFVSADIWTPLPDSINTVNAQTANFNFRGDLMLWVPPLALNCNASGIDPRNNTRCQDPTVPTSGGTPYGLLAGWVWSLSTPRYLNASDRELIYQAALSNGYTHFTLHVAACTPGDGYHNLEPTSSADCASYGSRLNTVLTELRAHGLTTVCMGLAFNASAQPGLDRSLCDIVGDDWDNRAEKDCNLEMMAREFPNKPLFIEMPAGALPQPDSCTPAGLLPSADGTAWINSVRQRFPNFRGMFYETLRAGVSQDIQAISREHTFWNERVQEVLFETDTYNKFWQNVGLAESFTYNNTILTGLPYLCGYMTGANINSLCRAGTIPPPPPPPGGGTTSTRSIYYVDPYTITAGQRLTISGQNLSTTVNFYAGGGGTSTQATGTLNRDATEVTVLVPATLAAGQYTVSVGPSPESNTVALTILAPSPAPTPGAAGATSAEPCDTGLIELGISILCDFFPETASPGDTIVATGVALTGATQIAPPSGIPININGTISNNGQLVTFVIPLNTAPGNYSITNAGTTGTATMTRTLSIVEPGTLPPSRTPNPPFAPPVTGQIPQATSFQDLISGAFNYSLIVVGIAVFIMIMWGGFLWLTSAANPGNIATAKRYIFNAILGAVLLISAYVILYTINPELVGGSLTLFGIPAPPPQTTSSSRLIATSEAGSALAVNAGCLISLDTRDFTAFECNPDIAGGLNLPFDPVITTTDIAVNTQIGVTAFQNNGGNQGAGRRIVVLDTGYNYTNPDLSSSYLGGRDFINNDNDPMDDNTTGGSAPGHGSHVAGIITGDGSDTRARGIAPQAGIIAGKVLDSAGNGNWSRLVDAIYWAVNGPDGVRGTADDFNADAINISMGAGLSGSYCDGADTTSQLLSTALRYAKDNGVLPVVSSGNSASGVSMPGCLEPALTVGAVDGNDRITYFSGRGTPVDVVAPGSGIYSTLLGANYGLKSGTSMATPVVSGIAALIKGANPTYTANQVEQTITSTACDLGTTGKDTTFGWGRVTMTPGNCTPPPPPTTTGPTGTVITTPTSCTKGAVAANPNCNTSIGYTISGITSATQITVGKDGNLFQNIQCSTNPCSGQLSDPNPNAGRHQYDFRLPNNSIIARGNSYIYTTGGITANFRSCAKYTNPANQNCDITLNIIAPGVSPNSIVIKKDGYNWRSIPCTNAQCTASVTDSDPAVGNHTYTLQDGSDNTNGRLGRASVVISDGAPPMPGPATTSCNATNTTCLSVQYWPANTNPVCGNRACVVLNHQVAAQDITGGYTGGILIRKSNCQIYAIDGQVATDLPAGTRIYYGDPVCGGISASNYTFQMWDGGLGNPAQQTILVTVVLNGGSGGGALYPNTVTLCTGANYTGTCEAFAMNNPDLNNSLVGNDAVSSMILNTTAGITLCQDTYYNGFCERFSSSDPDLSDNQVGDNTVSSMRN